MADINRWRSIADAKQYLENSNQTGTIVDTHIADPDGRTVIIKNKQSKSTINMPEPNENKIGGIGGSDAINEEKSSKGFNLGDTDHVVMKGDRVDTIAYTSQSQAEKGVAELKKYGTEPYISQENGMYVVRFGQPTKEGIKTRNKTVQFDNRESANLWYKMLMERGAKVNPPELTSEGKYVISEAKGRLYATRELAEEEKQRLEEIGYRSTVEPTEEGVYRLKRLDSNEFETKDEADKYVSQMAGKNIRLKSVGQEDGTWNTVKMGSNEFNTEQEAINRQAKLSQKDGNLRTKINRNADGTYTLEKMSPVEFQTYGEAFRRQAELNQKGIRTKTETTAEGTNIIRKLADNEFLNKDDAIQQRYNLQKKGINSDIVQGTDGVYRLAFNPNRQAGTPLNTPKYNTPIYEKSDEIKAYVQPRVAVSRKKIEETKQKGIISGLNQQTAGHKKRQKGYEKQEEGYNLRPETKKEKFQKQMKIASGKAEVITGKAQVITGKAQEKLANVTAKVQKVGTQAVEDLAPAAAVTATGLQAFGNVQEYVIPKATVLAKAAIAEYKPAKRLGEAPQRMASQNIPSAPEGAVKVFRTRAEADAMGERHYKIYDGQGVPRIAAKSVSRGSVVGGGTPKIGDLSTGQEAPGDKLMMGGASKVGNIRTSGSIDFTNNGKRVPTDEKEEGI
jgi:hypothetical protein